MNITRRDFMSGLTAVGAVWLTAAVACREAAPEAASHHPVPDAPVAPHVLGHFSPEDAAEIEAITARIIPTDETPGAREAGVVFFIDKALTTFAATEQATVAAGLLQLKKDVAARHPGQTKFSALTEVQQDALLTTIEKGEFFQSIRFATITGMFALPKYGGNKDYIGWELVGQDRAFEHKPPFGWYDHPENQRALLGRVL